MSTAAELLAVITTTLQDTAYTRWAQLELLGYMNVAQRDIARRLGIFRKVATLTVDATQSPATAFYTLPADLLDLNGLTLDGITLDRSTVDCLGNLWEGTTGTAREYLLGEFGPNLVRLYPYPTTATTGLKAYYVRRPTAIAATGSDPEVVEELQMALAYYAIHRAYLRDFEDNDPTKAEMYRQMYEAEIAQATPSAVRQRDASPRRIAADYF